MKLELATHEEIVRAADLAQDVLWDLHWNEDLEYLHREIPVSKEDRGIDYWWFAHAIDALVDGYERTLDEKYLERAHKVAHGVHRRTGHSFINDYFDDMAWMGLALLRLYEYTEEGFYLEQTEILFDEILTAWTDVAGGGIAWSRGSPQFKNAPVNGPTVILAAELYNLTGDEVYEAWAHKIFDWLHEVLRDPDSGYIADGINDHHDMQLTHRAYTYNHGTYIGAATELYLMTDDEKYLEYARKTFENAVDVYDSPSGINSETGEGDGGLFKGIFIRNLALYAAVADDAEAYDYIHRNASSVINHAMNENGRISDSWSGPRKETPQLSTHLSGIMLLEAAADIVSP